MEEEFSGIRESLGRLTELSDDELAALKDSVVSEFGTVREQELSQKVADNLTFLADAKDQIANEQKNRVQIASQLATQAEEAAKRMSEDDHANETSSEEAKVEENAEVEEEKTEFSETSEATTAVEAPVEAEASVSEETNNEKSEAELSANEPDAEVGEPNEEHLELKDPVQDKPEVTAPAVTYEEKTNDKISETEFASEEVDKESSEETVTASINSEELNLEVPSGRGPAEVTVVKAPITITAGADIPHVPAGSQLPDLKAVANAIIGRQRGMGRTSGGDGEQHSVATFTTEFPEARYLTRNDIEINRVKIDKVVEPKTITAAGGLAAPVEIRYELFGLGSTDRPVKDSLAVFGAERGGIRFVTPPVISDLSGAVGLWTLQDDIDAATAGAPDPVKPCLRVAAGAEVVVYLEAITLCLTFGNMGARAYPELVERHTELAMVNHARFSETRLLTRIGTLSTSVTAAAKLGAARDIFAQLDQAAAGYRSRHRIDVNSPLRAIFPAWFKNALRADLVKQIPGDGNADTFGLIDSKIEAWLKVRNINVTWAMDGETGQIFGTQAGGGVALSPFPTTVIWYLFAEGTFLFLDGGTLDLGLVRDSALNGTNDYKVFLETFEAVAKVGVESIRVTSNLLVLGASSATIA